MAKAEKIKALGWDNCIKLTGGGVELIVTTDVGPRILSYTLGGKENHLKVFERQAGTSGSDKFVPYGGHRVWHAPEQAGRTDTPDNSPCIYEIGEGSVTVINEPDCAGIVRGLCVSVDDDGVVTVDHLLRNTNLFDVELSIWGITQFEHGGLLAVPQSKLNTGLVANRMVALWPYCAMNDRRVYWGENFVTVTPDKQNTPAFKFGMSADEQYAAYFNHNQLIVKRFEYFYDVEYPNYACNFESYTNADFIEIESLSPLFTLEAGEESRHTEYWYAYDNVACPARTDEKAIAEAIRAARKE